MLKKSLHVNDSGCSWYQIIDSIWCCYNSGLDTDSSCPSYIYNLKVVLHIWICRLVETCSSFVKANILKTKIRSQTRLLSKISSRAIRLLKITELLVFS